MYRYIQLFALILLSLIIGFYAGIGYLKSKTESRTNATLMLDKIKDVFKIINVEGSFSEIMQEKSYAYFDISPFRKSIIIRVNAKVMVGYDLDSNSVIFNQVERTIKIKSNSTPKILSNEIQLDYYDLQQGTFNQFTPEELNQIQDKIKDNILRKTESSDLIPRAKIRNHELLQNLKKYCELLNWKLIVLDEKSGISLIN